MQFSKRLVATLCLTVVAGVWIALGHGRGMPSPTVPWTPAEVVTPQTLAKEIAGPKSKRPMVVCVGFEFLYRGAHVLGATYKGPAMNPGGLQELRAWAHSIPKNTPVVIYCGCCPMDRCPNVRPAFKALRAAGLSHLHVLEIPHNFNDDWVQKGYPTQKNP